jgi:hypothetical protein
MRTHRSFAIAAAMLAIALGPAAASAQIAQVDASLGMPVAGEARNRVEEVIEQGPATVVITALNMPADAVVVDLAFRYRVPPDTIALDELLDRLEIATETADGEPFFDAVIDAKLIPLNPNRVPLFYRVTLQRPAEGEHYRVHVKVFGNYE